MSCPPSTILVIDEDEDIRSIMGELLRHAGYHPVAAPTPAPTAGSRSLNRSAARPASTKAAPHSSGMRASSGRAISKLRSTDPCCRKP